MCEFIGFLRSEELNDYNDNISLDMTDLLCHRDSSFREIYCDENISLVSRSSDIIGLEDENYYLMLSGKIYNHSELKEKLSSMGIEPEGTTEEELILALYRYMGRGFVKELRGVFALIIWDKQERTLFVARDLFGAKPFYYMELLEGLYFSSGLKNFSCVQKISAKELNTSALQNYLTYQYVPEPDTILRDVHILEPGCTIEKTFGKGNIIHIDRYWNMQLTPIKRDRDKRMEQIRQALRDSVMHYMMGDVPIGSFLSGGIDSSIIVALASEIDPNIKTFTAGFEVDGYNEIDLARQIADELGVENISKIITPEDLMEEFPNIIWHMDVPVADPSAIPLYFISQEARKHVEVVLSGEGSDELFGGYNIYREPLSLSVFSYMPRVMKNRLMSVADRMPEGVKGKSFITRGCTPIEKRYVGNAHVFREDEKLRYLKKYDGSYTYDSVTRPYFEQALEYDDIAKMQYIDMNTWLRGDILVKSERMTRAHSLELRMPFLDRKVFEVASKLTLEDKIKGKTTKYALREAFRDLLPREVSDRKKLGYPVPIRCWLKDELYDWAVKIMKESNTDEYIDKAEALKLIEEHRRGHIDNSRKIWVILTFMMWHKIFIERDTKSVV